MIRNDNNGLPGVFVDNATEDSSSLSDLVEVASTEQKWRSTFINYNCGSPTFGLSMSAKEFYEYSRIANQTGDHEGGIAQRALNPTHAKALGVFLFKGLVQSAIFYAEAKGEEPGQGLLEIKEKLGPVVYVGIQPIVCNIRDIEKGVGSFEGRRAMDPKTNETACFRTSFLPKHILYVVDGQHRREGYRYVFDFIKSVLSSGKIGKQSNLILASDVVGDISDSWMRAFQAIDRAATAYSHVLVEAHLGLSLDEERQLFSDLNSRGLNVSKNLTLAFDGSNPVNEYVKIHSTGENALIKIPIIETEKDAEVTVADGAILRKDIVAINAQLFLGSSSIKSATAEKVQFREGIANKFWTQVGKIPGIGKPGLHKRSVLAQAVVLKAMAKLCYTLTPKKEGISTEDLDKYLDALPFIDFSHENMAWQIEQGPESLHQYTAYETSKTAQRGVGMYDETKSRFEFSTRANDVIAVLGDILRHELELPNRHNK